MINERATATKQPAESGHQATGVLQRACACGRHSGSGGECAECRKKRLGLQRRAVNNSGPEIAPPIVHEVLRSPGRPLDDATRGFMESRFNHDFSGVRVHNDERAAESARAVNALAYTVGNHVAFGAGQYAPGTILGRKMLAHELSHVVQQINGTAIDQLNGIKVDGVDTVWEQEATLIADSLTSTYSEPIHHTRTNRSLQRQDTRPGAPVVVPEIASLPANLYVDTFVEVHYDLSYRSVEGNLSTWLQVMYQDGTFIDISIYDIDDTRVNPHDALQMMANGRLGLGGRIFPQHLNSSTTPRLAAAKGEAIRIMEEYNFQFILGTLPAVVFILTMGVGTTGRLPSIRRSRVSRRIPRAAPVTGRLSEAAERTLRGLSGRDQQLMRRAMEESATRGGTFMDDLGALSRAIRDAIPDGQVHLLGTMADGARVYGSLITGTGITTINGVTHVVVMRAGSLVRIVGVFR